MSQENIETEDETVKSETQPMRSTYRLDDLIGKTIDGRYEIDELVGEGGMGAVFRARQLRLRRTAAIKVPKPEIIDQSDYRGRFEREALTMAKLIHQNIVQIYDVFISHTPNVPSFIAMEYVEGNHLGDYLKAQSSSLTLSAILDILTQVAQAIDAAHSHGIVHRDIKPSNILITMPQRVPKIMDFGIAKVEMENAFKTQNVEALGTPAYMSPEQVTGDKISPATDLYSFGIMVYHILANNYPYDVERREVRKVMQAHVNGSFIRISKRNPALPRSIDKLFFSILNTDPEKRPGSASKFMEELNGQLSDLKDRPLAHLYDLEKLIQPSKTGALSSNLKGNKNFVYATVFVALLFIAVALFGIVNNLSGEDESSADSSDVAAVSKTNFSDPVAEINNPELEEDSEDDTQVAMAAEEPEEIVKELESTPIPSNETEVIEPEVTLTPTPIPTPSPTPTPEPTPVSTPVPTATPNAPAVSPPTDLGEKMTNVYRIRNIRTAISDMINEQIEKPSFYGDFDAESNALARLSGRTPKDLINRIKDAANTHEKIDLSIKIEEGSDYWETYTDLIVSIKIAGYPKGHPNRDFRETIYIAPDPHYLIAKKNEAEEWELISLN